MENFDEIAVAGIVVHKNKCLFLKRKNPPINWCPPCGKLELGESFQQALKREVMEETGLDVNIILPVEIWSGIPYDKKILSIVYVCEAEKSNILLSSEHSQYEWIPIEEIDKMESKTDFDVAKWNNYINLAKIHKKDLLSSLFPIK